MGWWIEGEAVGGWGRALYTHQHHPWQVNTGCPGNFVPCFGIQEVGRPAGQKKMTYPGENLIWPVTQPNS